MGFLINQTSFFWLLFSIRWLESGTRGLYSVFFPSSVFMRHTKYPMSVDGKFIVHLMLLILFRFILESTEIQNFFNIVVSIGNETFQLSHFNLCSVRKTKMANPYHCETSPQTNREKTTKRYNKWMLMEWDTKLNPIRFYGFFIQKYYEKAPIGTYMLQALHMSWVTERA